MELVAADDLVAEAEPRIFYLFGSGVHVFVSALEHAHIYLENHLEHPADKTRIELIYRPLMVEDGPTHIDHTWSKTSLDHRMKVYTGRPTLGHG